MFADGLCQAHSQSPLDGGWADAMALLAEEADELLYRANASRADAKAKAKMGWN